MKVVELEQSANDPDDSEFVRLLTEHQHSIRNFVISLLPGAPGVDDVIQETNSVLWKKRNDFQLGTNFRAWALTIARYQTMAHIQTIRRRRWVTLDPDVAIKIADELIDHTADPAQLDQRLKALEGCLSELREQDKELILQRYWHRTRLQDFAVSAERSVSSLKVTLFRLRAGLKRCIEKRLSHLNQQ